MNYTIENNLLRVQISKEGAELCSLYSKATAQEYMWNGNPQVWGSTAPVLFPIIGALKEGKYTVDSQWYSLPKHGFIRHNNRLTARVLSESAVEFSLTSSPETRIMYPYEFTFKVVYELSGHTLYVRHEVWNKGADTMYFSLGGHPAFKCPFYENETYADYFIDFKHAISLERQLLSANGLVSTQRKPVLQQSSTLPLRPDLFVDDALIFLNIPVHTATLRSHRHQTAIEIRYPDFKNLGIWAKPNASFVCIEPWLGVADLVGHNQHLPEKDGILSLDSHQKFTASYAISLLESD